MSTLEDLRDIYMGPASIGEAMALHDITSNGFNSLGKVKIICFCKDLYLLEGGDCYYLFNHQKNLLRTSYKNLMSAIHCPVEGAWETFLLQGKNLSYLALVGEEAISLLALIRKGKVRFLAETTELIKFDKEDLLEILIKYDITLP